MPLEVTDRHVSADVFSNNGYGKNYEGSARAKGSVTLKQITYSTNDIWVMSAGLTPYANHPLLLCGTYGAGRIYVLNIPETPADLYKLPAETLTLLRKEMRLPVTIEGSARVGLFMYDNSTFIIQSFLDKPEDVRICISRENAALKPLSKLPPQNVRKARSSEGESLYEVTLMPGWYAAFRVE
jgi:hypothetical protein